MTVVPYHLMFHTCDHYQLVVTKDDDGGDIQTYVLTHRAFPCFVANGPSKLIDTYKTRQQMQLQTVYLCDASVYNAVNVSDRIVFQGVNYRVSNTQGVANLNVLYEIDLEEDLS